MNKNGTLSNYAITSNFVEALYFTDSGAALAFIIEQGFKNAIARDRTLFMPITASDKLGFNIIAISRDCNGEFLELLGLVAAKTRGTNCAH